MKSGHGHGEPYSTISTIISYKTNHTRCLFYFHEIYLYNSSRQGGHGASEKEGGDRDKRTGRAYATQQQEGRRRRRRQCPSTCPATISWTCRRWAKHANIQAAGYTEVGTVVHALARLGEQLGVGRGTDNTQGCGPVRERGGGACAGSPCLPTCLSGPSGTLLYSRRTLPTTTSPRY